jgi:ferredoxin
VILTPRADPAELRSEMRIHVDTDRCAGHGVCESLLPEVFEVGEDGIVHLLTDELHADQRDDLESAVAECPTQALRLDLDS